MDQKIFLRGQGEVKKEEESALQSIVDEGMEPVKEPEFQSDAVEYGAGMESLQDEEVETNLEESVPSEEPVLPISDDPGFDDSAAQDARKDSPAEGGTTNPRRSTGPMISNGALEGHTIKHEPLADSTPGAYELSGFHVEMKTDTGMVSVQITQDFQDLDTAKSAINGDKFLMPVKTGGFKVCKITRGAPIICFEEREILEYINNEWRKP